MTTQEYLADKGVTMEQAQTFVMENLDNVGNIFNVCQEFGVNNDMLADIVQTSFPDMTITGEIVSSFFSNSGLGLDGDALGFNLGVSTPAADGTLDVSNVLSHGTIQLWQNISQDVINLMPTYEQMGIIDSYAYASSDSWNSITDLGYADHYIQGANGVEVADYNNYHSNAVGIDFSITTAGASVPINTVGTIVGPYDLIIAMS